MNVSYPNSVIIYQWYKNEQMLEGARTAVLYKASTP